MQICSFVHASWHSSVSPQADESETAANPRSTEPRHIFTFFLPMTLQRTLYPMMTEGARAQRRRRTNRSAEELTSTNDVIEDRTPRVGAVAIGEAHAKAMVTGPRGS
jgi:hypothetical protein